MQPNKQILFTIIGSSDIYKFDTDSLTFTKITAATTGLVGVASGIATNGLGTYVVGSATDDDFYFSTDDGVTWSQVSSTAFTLESSPLAGIHWDRANSRFTTRNTNSYRNHSSDGDTWVNGDLNPIHSGGKRDFRVVDGEEIFALQDVNGSAQHIPQYFGRNTTNTLKTPTSIGYGAWETSFSGEDYGEIRRVVGFDGNHVLATSTQTNVMMWSELSGATSLLDFTNCTFTGSLRAWVAVKGDGYWIAAGDNWGYSSDGKAWTGVSDGALDDWIVLDGLFDGEKFWFTAAPTVAPLNAAAIFEYDPGGDYTAGTWTRHDVTDSPDAGADMICGWPAWDVFLEPAIDAGALTVTPYDVTGPINPLWQTGSLTATPYDSTNTVYVDGSYVTSDSLFQDVVTIELWRNGVLFNSVVPDVNGDFRFNFLTSGSYEVIVTNIPEEYWISFPFPDRTVSFTVDGGTSGAQAVNFQASRYSGVTFGGRVPYILQSDVFYDVDDGDTLSIPELQVGDYVTFVANGTGYCQTVGPLLADIDKVDIYADGLPDGFAGGGYRLITYYILDPSVVFYAGGPEGGWTSHVSYHIVRGATNFFRTDDFQNTSDGFPQCPYSSRTGKGLVISVSAYAASSVGFSTADTVLESFEMSPRSGYVYYAGGYSSYRVSYSPPASVLAYTSSIISNNLATHVFVDDTVVEGGADSGMTITNPAPVGANRIPVSE